MRGPAAVRGVVRPQATTGRNTADPHLTRTPLPATAATHSLSLISNVYHSSRCRNRNEAKRSFRSGWLLCGGRRIPQFVNIWRIPDAILRWISRMCWPYSLVFHSVICRSASCTQAFEKGAGPRYKPATRPGPWHRPLESCRNVVHKQGAWGGKAQGGFSVAKPSQAKAVRTPPPRSRARTSAPTSWAANQRPGRRTHGVLVLE